MVPSSGPSRVWGQALCIPVLCKSVGARGVRSLALQVRPPDEHCGVSGHHRAVPGEGLTSVDFLPWKLRDCLVLVGTYQRCSVSSCAAAPVVADALTQYSLEASASSLQSIQSISRPEFLRIMRRLAWSKAAARAVREGKSLQICRFRESRTPGTTEGSQFPAALQTRELGAGGAVF